jgi:hypothetical protein
MSEDFKIMKITTEATLHDLFQKVRTTGCRFYLFRDQISGIELGTIEILSVADQDIQLANTGARKVN